MPHHTEESHWISLSDMMTGLMLVFLLLTVLFMHQWQKDFVDYRDVRSELYEELDKQFKDKYQEWEMVLDDDLTIKFTNPEVLFGYRSAVVTSEFQIILGEFIPQYLGIITQDKYQDKISEVRIEGHTADWDDYMYTVRLSQERSDAVLERILSDSFFRTLGIEKQARLKFWLAANGYGNGRAIDKDGNFVFNSRSAISADSRRVEFRIVTRSDELIEKVISENLK